MKNIFTNHPRSIGEGYFEHFLFAFLFGTKMVIGGLSFIIHSIFPFVFQKTGSEILFELAKNFVERMPKVNEQVLILDKAIQQKTKSKVKSSDNVAILKEYR